MRASPPAPSRPRAPSRALRGTRRSARATRPRRRPDTASNVRQRATSWFASQGELDELPPGIGDRRERVPAIARQLGREPLPEVTDQRAIDEQRAIRVPVRIDEPRRDHESPGIDHLRHIARVDHRKVVDGEDAVSEDTDVGATPGRSRPIHDGPAAHEEVEGGHALMMTPRTGASPDGLRRASILRRGCPNTPTHRPTADPLLQSALRGAIAQLEEHLHGMQGVRGSSPRSSTRNVEPPTITPPPTAGVNRLRRTT